MFGLLDRRSGDDEDADGLLLEELNESVQLQAQDLDGVGLPTSVPHMLADCPPLPSMSDLAIVKHDRRMPIVGVDGDIIVLDQPVRSAPTLVSRVPE